MTHVFISYSHQDQEYARKLGDELRKRGIDHWMDDQTRTGDDWVNRIEQEILSSAAVIIIMSPDAEKSRWVKREILTAEDSEISILPLLLVGDKPPFLLRHSQYEDVRGNRIPSSRFFEQLESLIAQHRKPAGDKLAAWKKLTTTFLDPQVDRTTRIDAGYRISWYFPVVSPDQHEFFVDHIQHASDSELLSVIAAIHEALENDRDDVAENIANLFGYLPNNVERLKSLARGRQCTPDHLEALFQSIELLTEQFEDEFRDEISGLYDLHE